MLVWQHLANQSLSRSLGYEGDDDYVRNWAAEANKPHTEFPAMTAVVYFNDREVYNWPRNVGRPDWRVANHPLD